MRAGVIAYAYEDKTALLGVPAEMIATHGAVSEPVAVAMAEGIRERTSADVTVGITGIAGPGGGTASQAGRHRRDRRHRPGPAGVRAHVLVLSAAAPMVKFQATQAALDRVRRMLTDAADGFRLPASGFRLRSCSALSFQFARMRSGS